MASGTKPLDAVCHDGSVLRRREINDVGNGADGGHLEHGTQDGLLTGM